MTSFEAYDQLYTAYHQLQVNDTNRIKRRFGHSQAMVMDHKKRLLTTFGSSMDDTVRSKQSAITKKLIKNFKPKGAHLSGIKGGASEEAQVKEAQKRL